MDILRLGEALAPADTAFFAPEAAGRSWWPTNFLTPMAQLAPWLVSALATADRAVAAANPEGCADGDILLLGFSQGAALALEYATCGRRPFMGVCALSGGLVGTQDIECGATAVFYGDVPKQFTNAMLPSVLPTYLGFHAQDPHPGDSPMSSCPPPHGISDSPAQPYVLAVRSNLTLRFLDATGFVHTDPASLADAIEPDAWSAHAAGDGAKGLGLYNWARIAMPWVCVPGYERWLLIRRSRRDPEARAYYLVFAPAWVSLAELAGAAGLRWTIEACFQHAKDDLDLDHCEVRSWHGWHRHMTLCMAAAAFLARLAASIRLAASKPNERSPAATRAA